MSPEVSSVAGDDAVEIGGIALRFHETLLAALGAAGVVSLLGGLPVVGTQDGFRVHGSEMQAAVAVVDQPVFVAEPIFRLAGGVPGVGAGGGEAGLQSGCHGGIADGPGESAIA